MKLPKKYLWLAYEGAPRHLVKALELYGTTEVVGPKHNPIILEWAKELNISYRSDERTPVDSLLSSREWVGYGVKSPEPMLGDILVFSRNGGGHVGFYVGEDSKRYYVLGGNQGNQVNIVKIAKSRLLQARRPAYISQPLNIRKVHLNISESTSTNEA